jgi:hypothetical protein
VFLPAGIVGTFTRAAAGRAQKDRTLLANALRAQPGGVQPGPEPRSK